MKKIVKNNSSSFFQINGSKFYAFGYCLDNQKQIDQIIKELWDQHRKAVHICFGFISKSNNGIIEKFDDDGEPKGLAGKKILLALQNNDFINSLIVVVRYKTKSMLGSGLLSRSYYKVSELLLQNPNNFTEYKKMINLEVHINSPKDVSLILDMSKNNKLSIVENLNSKMIIQVDEKEIEAIKHKFNLD